MTSEMLLQVAQSTVYTILMVTAPVLGAGLLIGLMVSIFQATTQIQEQTLAYIPKIVVSLLTLIFFGPWMLRMLVEFTQGIFGNLHRFVG